MDTLFTTYFTNIYIVVCGMQKQSKGKAARMQANLAGFESLAKLAEEPWYDTIDC